VELWMADMSGGSIEKKQILPPGVNFIKLF
jgi:hypothetical protein